MHGRRKSLGFEVAPKPQQPVIVVAPSNVINTGNGLVPDGSSNDTTLSGKSKNEIAVVQLPLEAQTSAINIPLGAFDANSAFPPQVEIGGNSIRVTTLQFGSGGLPISLSILPIKLMNSHTGNLSLEPYGDKPIFHQLDWQPVQRVARRIPTLAYDCDKFAFLSFSTEYNSKTIGSNSELRHPILYVGNFDSEATSKVLDFGLNANAERSSSVAISRGCSEVVVHLPSEMGGESTDFERDQVQDKLIVLHLNRDSFDAVSEQAYDLPRKLSGSTLPSFPLNFPALASARVKTSGKIRVAWVIGRGLAVVDLGPNGKATGLLSKDQVCLTGINYTPGIVRVTISKDGNFLMVSQQRTYAAAPDVRIFDLRISMRTALLSNLNGPELRDLACAIASFLPGSNRFS